MDTLLKILNEVTALKTDTDLFAYEIGLDKGGVWLEEVNVATRFNGTGYEEYNMYYRGKNKTQSMANLKYLKNTIDGLSGSTGTCALADGTTFSLKRLNTFEYLGKDAEGYFVWSTRLALLTDAPTPHISA